MHGRLWLGLVIPGMLFTAVTAAQAPAMGPEFQVNQSTLYDQKFPSLAIGGTGNFVVVWTAPSYAAVTARRFDAAGSSLGDDFQVNTNTASQQVFPAVASDEAGDFVVAWTIAYPGDGVVARRFDSTGTPAGPDFPVNTYTTGFQGHARVAMGPDGGFVVVWTSGEEDGSDGGIFGQRYDSSGNAQGAEFQVNTYSTGDQTRPAVAMSDWGFVVVWQDYGRESAVVGQRFDSAGNPLGLEFQVSFGHGEVVDVSTEPLGRFVVAWTDPGSDLYLDIAARHYDNAGIPLTDPFVVNTYTTGTQFRSSVAMGATGDFVVAWTDYGRDPSGDLFAQRFESSGSRVGAEFPINTTTADKQTQPWIGQDGRGQFVAVWESLLQDGSGYGIIARRGGFPDGQPMSVDERTVGAGPEHSAPTLSKQNGILEAGERVAVDTAWANPSTTDLLLTGSASNLTGPPGPVYTLHDAAADYGTILAGSFADCFTATGNCYEIEVSGARPQGHFDAAFDEALSTGVAKSWTLHVGESFPDVSTLDQFYGFIENIFHNGITGGCGLGNYCPTSSVTRAQMAVFLLKAKHGSTYLPPGCTGTFPDVPCPSLFADWIEQLAAEGTTGGCGSGNYCPDNPVTRAQMAAFLLKSEHGSTYVPPTCSGTFVDVTCPSLFADWIEQLAAEQITGGCGGGNYCPNNPNTRGQMAVFLVKTFGLQLYGP